MTVSNQRICEKHRRQEVGGNVSAAGSSGRSGLAIVGSARACRGRRQCRADQRQQPTRRQDSSVAVLLDGGGATADDANSRDSEPA